MLPLFTTDTSFADSEPNVHISKSSLSSEDTGNRSSSSMSGIIVFLWILSYWHNLFLLANLTSVIATQEVVLLITVILNVRCWNWSGNNKVIGKIKTTTATYRVINTSSLCKISKPLRKNIWSWPDCRDRQAVPWCPLLKSPSPHALHAKELHRHYHRQT